MEIFGNIRNSNEILKVWSNCCYCFGIEDTLSQDNVALAALSLPVVAFHSSIFKN